jgi:hypothetical protein
MFGDAGEPAPTGPKPRKPRMVTLRVKVTAADRKTAERLAKMRTLQGIEAMLGELVADIATAYERPGSWEAGRVWDWLDSHYPPTHFLRLERDGKEAKNAPL